MTKLLTAAILLFVGALASAQSSTDYSGLLSKAGFQIPKAKIASEDFELPGLDGKAVKLSAMKGSVVLLNFWATWCPPCRAEIPSMEAFYTRLKAKGLKILAVDLAEDEAKVKDFASSNKMATTVLLDADGAVGGTYGAESIPTTYIVAKDGSILGRTIGGRDWNTPEMIGLFATLLAGN